jgi:hypothetical protein
VLALIRCNWSGVFESALGHACQNGVKHRPGVLRAEVFRHRVVSPLLEGYGMPIVHCHCRSHGPMKLSCARDIVGKCEDLIPCLQNSSGTGQGQVQPAPHVGGQLARPPNRVTPGCAPVQTNHLEQHSCLVRWTPRQPTEAQQHAAQVVHPTSSAAYTQTGKARRRQFWHGSPPLTPTESHRDGAQWAGRLKASRQTNTLTVCAFVSQHVLAKQCIYICSSAVRASHILWLRHACWLRCARCEPGGRA